MPASLQHPEQELRFTRAAQAVPFWLAAAVLAACSVTLLATASCRDINPSLPHAWWSLLPLAAAMTLLRIAYRMTRHAYLILTPMGIEIFPWFRLAAGMRVVFWQEIAAVEVDPAATRLTLHFDEARTSGIHLSLRPVPRGARPLLLQAVMQRVVKK